MDWVKFFIAVYEVVILLAIVSTVMMIGRKRDPISPGAAVFIVMMNLFFFLVFLTALGRL